MARTSGYTCVFVSLILFVLAAYLLSPPISALPIKVMPASPSLISSSSSTVNTPFSAPLPSSSFTSFPLVSPSNPISNTTKSAKKGVLCPAPSCFGETAKSPIFVSQFYRNIGQGQCYFKYDLNHQVQSCKQLCREYGTSPVLKSLRPSSKFLNHTNDDKYANRAKQGYCKKQGMWAGHHTGFTSCPVMFAGWVFGYKPGDLIFDWGSGCGHQATWMAGIFGVHVLGIDLADEGVAWSRNHSVGTFFAGNGMQLEWIPDNTFNHAYSYAAIYHLNHDRGKSQCAVYKELLRIVKPGGTVFDGWKPEHSWFKGPYTKKMLLECFANVKGVSYNVYNETDLYGGVGHELPGSVVILRKTNKGLSDVVGNLRTIPNMTPKKLIGDKIAGLRQ